jgi:hypothetical protein
LENVQQWFDGAQAELCYPLTSERTPKCKEEVNDGGWIRLKSVGEMLEIYYESECGKINVLAYAFRFAFH